MQKVLRICLIVCVAIFCLLVVGIVGVLFYYNNEEALTKNSPVDETLVVDVEPTVTPAPIYREDEGYTEDYVLATYSRDSSKPLTYSTEINKVVIEKEYDSDSKVPKYIQTYSDVNTISRDSLLSYIEDYITNVEGSFDENKLGSSAGHGDGIISQWYMEPEKEIAYEFLVCTLNTTKEGCVQVYVYTYTYEELK